MDSPQEINDIFSLSDDVLAEKLTFIEEIGNGNWGSVWRCKPKTDPSAATAEDFDKVLRPHIAVKVVHRETKSKTSVARVKSLWNEMKIIRTFKSDPHPSIVPFYSFIITPSFALITMALLPTLVPVEVDETQARGWFRYLLSGVEFLHKRGVVHNDIKPANILVSEKNVPVLVDFGFAERYDLSSDTAFHSKVAYGTPEYLSPERAREIPHDTRKSDVWSLGVTFFEILVGRTPFEESDQEQFTTKEDLEQYWGRTLRGKWVGTWKMSRGMEKLLHRMIAPNADLRCTVSQAMKDSYWTSVRETESQHRRSSSYASTIVFEKDMSKLIDFTPTRSRFTKGKENPTTPPGMFSPRSRNEDPLGHHSLARSKSQPKVTASKPTQVQPRKRAPAPPITDLSPIKASPPASPRAGAPLSTISANVKPGGSKTRNPLGPQTRENLPDKRVKARDMHVTVRKPVKGKEVAKEVKVDIVEKENHVNQRVRDWERLREISRMDDTEDETDMDAEALTPAPRRPEGDSVVQERHPSPAPPESPSMSSTVASPIRGAAPAYIPALPTFAPLTLSSKASSPELSRTLPSAYSPRPVTKKTSASALNGFKHGIKLSIDKTLQLCKSSTLGSGGKKTRSYSVDFKDVSQSSEPWMVSSTNASTPALNETSTQAADRISAWMRNVERVVDDARMNFGSSPSPPLVENEAPPLSPPPGRLSSSQTRSHRSARLPRRVLAANQIFADGVETGLSPNSSYVTSGYTSPTPSSTGPSSPGLDVPVIFTPSKQRQDASSSDLRPAALGTPLRRREKSRSHADLLGMEINPLGTVDLDSRSKMSSPRPSPPLDRRMFITTPRQSRESIHSGTPMNKSFDELTSSPLQVEPYPQRIPSATEVLPDTPNQRRLEGVYDRFLMATSGVKRLGKGYQSDNFGPMYNTVHGNGVAHQKPAPKFASVRRSRMPPAVSSEDVNKQQATMSVDELGMMTYSGPATTTSTTSKDDGNATVARMRRAIKAIVPGKAVVSRRVSRVY